jgi:hypothetical protein
MGVDWNAAKFLIQAKRDGVSFERCLTLGRQNRFVSMPKVRQLLESNGLPHTLTEEEMTMETGYCEPVLMQLGAKVVDSIDASDYEHATVVVDMNKPTPAELNEKYDLVFDGGTLEHVFHVPQAFANAMSLPKSGGSLIIHTMANNWCGHGFYQFSPELFYRVLSPENGYRIVRMVAHASYEQAPWYEIPDPAQVRSRIELASPWNGVMLLVHARREAVVPLFTKTPQQSDYSTLWEESGEMAGQSNSPPVTVNSTNGNEVQALSFRRRMVISLKKHLPWAVRMKHKLLLDHPTAPQLLNRWSHRNDRKRFSVQAQPEKFIPTK